MSRKFATSMRDTRIPKGDPFHLWQLECRRGRDHDEYEAVFTLKDIHGNQLKTEAMTRKKAKELNEKLGDSGYGWVLGGKL